MMLRLRALVAVPLFLLAAPPVAATVTVNATADSFDSTRTVSWVAVRPAPTGTITQSGVLAARINATSNSGSYSYALLGGTAPGGFAAFCIEPMEFVSVGTPVDYKVVQLSRAASGLGGIGTTKANQIRELIGRNMPIGGLAAMTALTNSALQLAIWEIVMEAPGNRLAIGDRALDRGNYYVRNGVGAASAITLATSMLNAIDGTGPLAKGLVVLQNGTFGVQGGGSQDMLAFAGVPEPSSWALLIAGFGLTGAALRRRRAAITRAI